MPSQKPYTPAEITLLRTLYPAALQADILAAFPGRRWETIARKANSLGIKRLKTMPGQWLPEELAILRKHYPIGGAAAVLPLLTRKIAASAIHSVATRQGIKRAYTTPVVRVKVAYRYYTEAEQTLLRQLYPRATQDELLAAFPNRSLKGLSKQAQALGIARHAIHWCPSEDAYMLMHYPTDGPAAVGQALNRSVRQVISHAHKLHLRFRKPTIPKPVKQPKVKAVKVLAPKPAKVLLERPEPKALPMPGVQSNFSTPVLNAQKAAKVAAAKLTEQEKKKLALVPATELAKLPYTHPARMAYTVNAKNGGHAASQAYHQVMNTLKQVA
jgi:hypothetical protein